MMQSCFDGSETGNPTKGTAGILKTPDGVAAAHTRVYLLPRDFNPLDMVSGKAVIPSDTTDATGHFRFLGIDSGIYNLEALDLVAGTRANLKGIAIGKGVVELPEQSLKYPGKLSVSLTGAADTSGGYIYVTGTTLYKKIIASSGTVTFDSVPVGKVDSIQYGNLTRGKSSRVFAWDLLVQADTTTTATGPYLAWKNSRTLLLNTTAEGAAVPGTVTRFPLLVRLTSANFDFSTARSNGRQALRLVWGNGNATNTSAGTVFQTADGYAGVWHLDEDPSNPSPQFHDASDRKNHGIAIGYGSSATATGGLLEGSMGLDGSAQFSGTQKSFDNPQIFTTGLWFRTTSTSGGKLLDFTEVDTAVAMVNRDRHIFMTNNGMIHFSVYPPASPTQSGVSPGIFKTIDSPKPLNDGKWHQVVTRLSASGQALFVDGVRVSYDPASTVAENITGYWRWGYGTLDQWAPTGTGYYFKGALDELWVAYAERSDDYIKLLYENQRQDSRLVEFP